MRLLSRLLFTFFAFWLYPILPTATFAQWLPLNPVRSVETQADGALLVLENGFLRFQICSDSVVHIVCSLQRAVPKRTNRGRFALCS
jgi:hypothetical protein